MKKLGLALTFSLVLVLGLTTVYAGELKVGVVDDALTYKGFWIADGGYEDVWVSSKIVTEFEKHGLKAEVIGFDVLTDLNKLKEYDAIMIPTDHNYPEWDEGVHGGIVAQNLEAFTKAGGIFIPSMGIASWQAYNSNTGELTPADPFQVTFYTAEGSEGFDFAGAFGFAYPMGTTASPQYIITEEGKEAGITDVYGLEESGVVDFRIAGGQHEIMTRYVTVQPGPALYSLAIGDGHMIHCGAGPFINEVYRDWVIGAYAKIIKYLNG